MKPQPQRSLADDHDRFLKLGALAFAGFGAMTAIFGVFLTFDDPAGIVVILFGLVFVGAGWLVRRIFLASAGKRLVTVSADAFAARRHDGAFAQRQSAYLIEVDEDASPAEVAAAQAEWSARRFAERPDWATGRVLAENQRRGGLHRITAAIWAVLAILAVGAGFIWGGMAWIAAMGSVPFAAALGFVAVRDHVRRRKFGESVYAMAATPARLGGRLEGAVETAFPLDRSPEGGFQLRLRCLRRWEERAGGAGSRPTENVVRTKILWEAKGRAKPHIVGSGLAADVAFDLPHELPPSTLGGAAEGVFWELTISAETPGIDYEARFLVPVLSPETAV